MPFLNDLLDFSDHPLMLRPLHNYLQNTFPPSGYNTA